MWRKARSPPGEFVRANSKKVGTDPTFSQRIFSLTNHIAKICFSLRVARKNSPSGERALYALFTITFSQQFDNFDQPKT
jgi:hypothetical protein